MSAVSIPSSDDLLRMLTNRAEIAQNDPTPPAHPGTSNTRNLETLVRLIVRDELQHHVQPQPSETSDAESATKDDDARRLAPARGPADSATGGDSDAEVMNAEDVAAFLGVDRNTVYDYAGRGTIPCRRLGKRLLFHRPALVSWLDPCKAASTRKA
jgi:excisionase family DNA binding protein